MQAIEINLRKLIYNNKLSSTKILQKKGNATEALNGVKQLSRFNHTVHGQSW